MKKLIVLSLVLLVIFGTRLFGKDANDANSQTATGENAQQKSEQAKAAEKPNAEKAIDVSSHTVVAGKDGSLQFVTDTPVTTTDQVGSSENTSFKAKSVSIIRGGWASCHGQMSYAITSSGPGPAEPANPNIIVICEVVADDVEKAKALGLKVGGAYLNKGSGKYEFLKDVNLPLSDEEIARQFGVPKGSSVDVIDSGRYFHWANISKAGAASRAQNLNPEQISLLMRKRCETRAMLSMQESGGQKIWVFILQDSNDKVERIPAAKEGAAIGKATGSEIRFGDKALDPQSMLQGENLVEKVHANGFVFIKGDDQKPGRLFASRFDDGSGGIMGDILSCLGVGSSIRFDNKNWIDFMESKYRKGGVAITAESVIFQTGTENLRTDGTTAVYDGSRWAIAGEQEEPGGYVPFVIKEMDPGNDPETKTRLVVKTDPQLNVNLYGTDAPGCLHDFGSGTSSMFNPNAELIFVQKGTKFGLATFDSQSEYPLVFKLVKGVGCTYICGRGTVRTPDGKSHELGQNDTANMWLSRTTSSNAIVREGAAQALGWLAKTDKERNQVLPLLVKALQDNDPDVRRGSCESLGRIGNRTAIEHLKPLINDESERCKLTAQWALKQIEKTEQERPLPKDSK